MNGLPVEKSQEWLKELSIARPLPQLALRRILRDAGAEVQKNVGTDEARRLYLLLAAARFRDGDFTASLEDAGRAFRLSPSGAELARCRLLMGVAKVALGQPDAALDDLAAYVRQLPAEPQGWANLAEVHFRLGDLQRAYRSFAEAERLAQRDDAETAALLSAQAAELGLLDAVERHTSTHRKQVGEAAYEAVLQERHMAKVRRLTSLAVRGPRTQPDHAVHVQSEPHAEEQLRVLEAFSDLRDAALVESRDGQAPSGT